MYKEVYKVKDVFVAGGQPAYTYVPREHLHLEDKITLYLDELYKILSISGPTKSGKTVLVRKLIPRDKSIWISGGQIEDIDDFWEILNDQYENYSSQVEKTTKAETHSESRDIDASIKPMGMGGGVKSSVGDTDSSSAETTRMRNFDPKRMAIKSLIEHKLPLVIDDFHYIQKDVQTIIVRSLKDVVYDGLPVILL